jgi:hypothetical protein
MQADSKKDVKEKRFSSFTYYTKRPTGETQKQ